MTDPALVCGVAALVVALLTAGGLAPELAILPLLALVFPVKAAILTAAAVSLVCHLAAWAQAPYRDSPAGRSTLAVAAAALAGAVVWMLLPGTVLRPILGATLLLAGLLAAWRPSGPRAAGLEPLAGLLRGLVGVNPGLRLAPALLVVADAVRLAVYVSAQAADVARLVSFLLPLAGATLLGALLGRVVLRRRGRPLLRGLALVIAAILALHLFLTAW
ncbi:MAG TPA: hypothetical protein VGM19_14060 [Armatimonadota bacterium]|jgi:hypothetical protein